MHRRHIHIDLAKILAAHFIVLHHFTAYGPLAESWDTATVALTGWLFDYGRMAVQVFLVIGGYLAAMGLAPQGKLKAAAPWRPIAQRYLRLAPSYAVALLLTIAASLFANQWLDSDFIPGTPDIGQFAAHLALLNGFVDFEPLTVGTWYVAMDFQLFALLTLMLWVGRRWARWMVAAMAIASLFYFNLNESRSDWAPYFFGAYGMGAIAWWAGRSKHAVRYLTLLALIGAAALLWDFRLRIALAGATALMLGVGLWHRTRIAAPPVLPNTARYMPGWLTPVISALARSSYALFLVHFSVLILANTWFAQLHTSRSITVWCMLIGAWAVSQAVALVFERWVERPLSQLKL
jgi:peptidoglycan/LPS O-acetylase OafA/YrhL